MSEPANINAASYVERVVLAPEVYHLNPPSVVQQDCKNVDNDAEMRTLPISLTEVSDAKLFFNGPKWFARDSNGAEVFRSNMSNEDLSQAETSEYRELSGTVFLLGTSAGAHCYYHWMLDILPKLGLLELAGIQLADVDHFLVREVNGSFHKETLARLGIDAKKIVVTKDDSYLRCEKLLHIDLRNGGGMKMHRFVPQWMKHVYPPVYPTGERIKLYISRPEGVRRGVANESELIPILKSYGYTITAMEGMSVLEQAQLLARADVLISPHGGALTNMVFCQPGIQILELFGNYVFPFYHGLAEMCAHKYHAIVNDSSDYTRLIKFSEAIKVDSEVLKETRKSSFHIDSHTFEKALEKMDRTLQ